MRKTTAFGASLLLAAGLAAGMAGPAAALTTTYPDSHGSSGHHDGRDRGGDRGGDKDRGDGKWDKHVGDRWDGGAGYHDGKRYEWPSGTRNYDDKVCPDMDVPKTDVSGDKKTITLTAPEGKLIAAYCVKAGSYQQGMGPKIVELDEPVAQITIAYPVQGGCKGISHYSVKYVDATTPSPSPSPTPSPSDTPSPEPSVEPSPSPSATTPVVGPDEPTETPSPTTPETPDDSEESEVVPPVEESPSPAASEAAPTEDDIENAGPGTVVDGGVDTEQPAQLAVTGPQVAALVLAAIALIGAGVAAVVMARRRRAVQA